MTRSLLSTAALALLVAGPLLAGEKTYKYTVKEGDSIDCFSQRAGVMAGELARLNGGNVNSMKFKLVAGKTILSPVPIKPDLCAKFPLSRTEGARKPATERACELIDRTQKYTEKKAIGMLHAILENKACVKMAEIASQPTVAALCEAIGHLLHGNHATHAYATGIEMLCESAHLAAHQVHSAAGHDDSGHKKKQK